MRYTKMTGRICIFPHPHAGACSYGRIAERETTQVLYLGPGEVPAEAKLIPESEALQRIASAVADEAFRHWCRLMEKYESAAYLADERGRLALQAQQDAKSCIRLWAEETENFRRKEKLADLCLDAYAAQLNTACGLAFEFGRLQGRARSAQSSWAEANVALDLARYGV